jgi:hypothetical protein
MKSRETRSGYRIIRVLSGRSNVFLLTDGEKPILIDTGPGYMWKLMQKQFENCPITSTFMQNYKEKSVK